MMQVLKTVTFIGQSPEIACVKTKLSSGKLGNTLRKHAHARYCDFSIVLHYNLKKPLSFAWNIAPLIRCSLLRKRYSPIPVPFIVELFHNNNSIRYVSFLISRPRITPIHIDHSVKQIIQYTITEHQIPLWFSIVVLINPFKGPNDVVIRFCLPTFRQPAFWSVAWHSEFSAFIIQNSSESRPLFCILLQLITVMILSLRTDRSG